MAKIGFIGLGNMGLPMALNLVRAGHDVHGFDLSEMALATLGEAGGKIAATVADAVGQAEIVITMLPAGKHVRSVYQGSEGVLSNAPAGTLLIDCSTIDVAMARLNAADAEKAGHLAVDAPVSGGVGGAAGATLTFMVGGPDAAFAKAEPVLQIMGKTIVHCGGAGNGQAAKICNNMILGITMVATCEAFALAEKLGLESDKLFAVSSKSSGQSWSLTSYCPVPGPVPTSPANRGYAPGFAADMMLKDLKLAQEASIAAGAQTPLGAAAAQLYGLFSANGQGGKDFSGIIEFLRGECKVK